MVAKETKMRLMLLVTDKMKPIPEDVSVLDDWGYVAIQTNTDNIIGGDHMFVEANEDSIKNWLRPFDGVWLQKRGTSPMLQEFEIAHIPLDK